MVAAMTSKFTVLALLLALVAGCGDGTRSRDVGPADTGLGADGGIDVGADAGAIDAPAELDGGTVPVATVRQVQDPASTGHVLPGARVRIEGAVLAAVDAYEENGAGMGNLGDAWIADPAGGPFSGLHVYMPSHVPCSGSAVLRLGDRVDVEGTVQEFAVPSDGSGRTVTQLIAGTITCTAAGPEPLPAVVADPATLTTDDGAEAYEGMLVQIASVEATADPDRFGTQTLRVGPPIDDDLYAHPGTARDRFTTARGIFHYMFGRWELLPRAASDLVLGAPRDLEDGAGAWGCADGADSDGDAAVDCADADCAGSAFCAGVTVSVQQLQDGAASGHPSASTNVTLRGPLVVTSIDGYAEATGAGYTGTIVVQDPSAADPRFSGVHVYVPIVEACGAGLALGDRVFVAGRYEEYAEPGDAGALTELRGGFVSCQTSGAPLAPTVLTPADLAPASAEPWEGVLVSLADVNVLTAPGAFGRFSVTGDVAVDDDVFRTTVVAGDHLALLSGVLTYQFEFQVEPRMTEDVVVGPSERDDASCMNGTDDDADGAIDCSDLDCCGSAPCLGAARTRGLVLSEVFYDASGADDGREWIEIRNAGSTPLPLACYAMGSGAVSYLYSTAQLPPIEVPAGGCVVIGGPDCGGGACTSNVDFTPDLHNGTTGSASGVAIVYGLASDIGSATVPVDAVLYGTSNTAMLRDASGSAPATAHVADVTAGHSIGRAADGSWVDQTTPSPGSCALYTP